MRVWYFQITASFLIMAVCVKFQNIDSHYHAKIQSVAHFFFFFVFLLEVVRKFNDGNQVEGEKKN